jgi:predicted dehydrogenase
VEHAALGPLGAIALQGVRKAAIEPGERVVVLGAGLIGQLAAQLAAVAGGLVTLVATSDARLAVARRAGVPATLNARESPDALGALAAAAVLDVTGNPRALLDACRAAATGARIVLLGSTRGTTRGFEISLLQQKQLELIGAHVATLPAVGCYERQWPWRRELGSVLELTAQGRLSLEPLVTDRLVPDAIARFYEEASAGVRKPVGAIVDWRQPGSWRSRVERPSPARLLGAGLRRLVGRPIPPQPSFLPRRADARILRFGLIGCGEIAAESAAGIRAATNAVIAFTMDPEIALARSLGADTGARTTTEVDELLASPEVDAVLISTPHHLPHHLHAPLAIRAAQAGKHVLVEKPMATSVADARRMAAAAAEAGVVLSVAYPQRFDPKVRRAKSLVDEGAIGDVLSTRITFGQLRSEAYWTRGLTGRTVSDWRSRPETAGGGVLIMNACHILEFMFWLVGSDACEVTACTATLAQRVEVEDTSP